MMQTRAQSAIETGLNVGSGAFLAWLATLWLLPHWSAPYTGWTALQITALYTGISLGRSYLWRRYFNAN